MSEKNWSGGKIFNMPDEIHLMFPFRYKNYNCAINGTTGTCKLFIDDDFMIFDSLEQAKTFCDIRDKFERWEYFK